MTRILTLSLAASLLAGCATMEPRYARPDQAVSEEFPRGRAYPVRGSSQPWADIGWNDFFADPRLKSLIDTALANNRDLRVTIANIDKARAQYRIQRARSSRPCRASVMQASGGHRPMLRPPGSDRARNPIR